MSNYSIVISEGNRSNVSIDVLVISCYDSGTATVVVDAIGVATRKLADRSRGKLCSFSIVIKRIYRRSMNLN